MKSKVEWIRRAQRCIRMLAELHRLGFQGLRGMPYMNPLGFRFAIAPKRYFSERNGAVIPMSGLSGEYVAITGAGDYFGWLDASKDDARALAKKFIERFPEIARQGRERDWAYAGWLAELVGFLEQGDWVPTMWWEHMKGEPEDLRTLPIWVDGQDNYRWEGAVSTISPDTPTFPLPPCASSAPAPVSPTFELRSEDHRTLGLTTEAKRGLKSREVGLVANGYGVRPEDFWKRLQQMPERHDILYPKRYFSAQEMNRIRGGFQPQSDDDKWFLYFSGVHLYMHRSWTGDLIYDVRFAFLSDGGAYVSEVTVNRDPQQRDGSATDDDDLVLLEKIICYHLLGAPDAQYSRCEARQAEAVAARVPGKQVILKVGSEGGSITLFGLQSPEGWTFELDRDESAVLELIEEDGLHPFPRLPLATWRGALKRLDQYPWAQLYPLEVHPEFRGRVCAALKTRQRKGVWIDWNLWGKELGVVSLGKG